MRLQKYCLAAIGLFVALLCFGVAIVKLLIPSLMGVWVGPQALFVIGIPSPDPKAVELMGDAFAPVFFVLGYLLAGFSWNRIGDLRKTPKQSLYQIN